MAKHGLEGLPIVLWFMSIFTSCHVFYMHQNGSAGTIFSLSCGCWDLSWNKHLEHGKTWLGRRSSCFVTCVNLHKLPCICIKMAAAVKIIYVYIYIHVPVNYCNAGWNKREAEHMAKDCLDGVSVVWWFLLIFTIFPMFVHRFFASLVTFGITVQKKEVWNMAKHGLEDVSVVWLFMLALYVHQNGSEDFKLGKNT